MIPTSLHYIQHTIWQRVKILLDLSASARKEGLLSLEDFLSKDNYSHYNLLHIGIRLVIDGTDQKYIARYLVTSIRTRRDADWCYTRLDELIDHITSRGILDIQSGYSPRLIMLKIDTLIPYVLKGVEYNALFAQITGMAELNKRHVESMANKSSCPIVQADDVKIQKAMRSFDSYELAMIIEFRSETGNAFERNMTAACFEQIQQYQPVTKSQEECKEMFDRFLLELNKV